MDPNGRQWTPMDPNIVHINSRIPLSIMGLILIDFLFQSSLMNLQILGWDRIPTLAWIQKNKETSK